MTIKFDLEAAKRGEPVEYKEAYGWVEIPFIGAWTNPDYVVCEVPWSDKPECVPLGKLRMANKKEIVRYRVALMNGLSADGYYAVTVIDEKEAVDLKTHAKAFIKWLTDWQEYEIGANDEQK